MKVAVLGAGGIVGQHMILRKPVDIDAVFTRREALPPIYEALDADDTRDVVNFLDAHEPDVIVNLVGENNVDTVEKNPKEYEYINARFPAMLAGWCDRHDSHLIQVSTQGVFSGEDAPYSPGDQTSPLTAYGKQKAEAETWTLTSGYTVARLTFVLGTRPFAGIGRENPFEQMVRMSEQSQVDDRFFSPVFAHDAAVQLWELVRHAPLEAHIYHIGIPSRMSRYQVASHISWFKQMVNEPKMTIHKVSHNHFPGIAPRPKDTAWEYGSIYSEGLDEGIADSFFDYKRREKMNLDTRAREISLFLGESENEVRERLAKGFHHNHALVAQDFKGAGADTSNEASLLDWYRNTTAYIYELSAYHLEEGFNYSGMCTGLADHLVIREKTQPLALGDGIGDLTIEMAKRPQLNPTYHDLAGSKTAEFAQFRFGLNLSDEIPVDLTDGWAPNLAVEAYDAVVALDFFEHLVNVEEWVRAVHASLIPGGLFLAQNAFAIGDAEHGDSIPMHLSVNNRFVDDWDPLLRAVGFEATGEGTWWRKA